MLKKGVGFKVGVGSRVRFWVDEWVGVGTLCVLFPRLFHLASNNLSRVSDCYV